MPYIDVNDLKLYYEELGTGEPILFLHSHFSRGILAFGAQIQPFQGKYRCIIPDFRGHGRTICVNLEWDSRQIADDMAEFIGKLKLEKVHLFAYSAGTNVAFYMAVKYPDKIKSIVAIGAGTKPMTEGSEDFLPDAIIKRNDVKQIETMTSRHFDAHRGNWQKFMEQSVKDWRNHPDLTENEWKQIKCPVLFINGENDPFGNIGELREKVSYAETYEIKNGSHRPHFVMEHGKEVNNIVLKFMGKM